jgi:hypothetical protein
VTSTLTPTLNLVGAGHVGRVLGQLFAASGAFTLQDVLTRSPASAQGAVAFIGAGHACAGGGSGGGSAGNTEAGCCCCCCSSANAGAGSAAGSASPPQGLLAATA